MFNVGPFELLVLAAVALLVFGPDKLPQLAKDAARMLRTLRDIAQGARTQLTSELGPEFENFDLNSLNPKTAIRNALLGDDDDLSSLNPKDYLQRALRGEDDPKPGGSGATTYSTQPDPQPFAQPASEPTSPNGVVPSAAAPFDPDAT